MPKLRTSDVLCDSPGSSSATATVPVAAAPSGVAPAIPGTTAATLTETSGVNPGVHGWLAFFCVSLTILTPLLGAGSLWIE